MLLLSHYFGQIVDGIAYGSIYGLMALSIVVLYRSNKLINFAQTEMATLSVICMFYLLKKMSFAPAFILTIIISFAGGVFLHFSILRFLTERQKVLKAGQALITIGFFSIFNSLSSYILGDETYPFPSPFGTESFEILGVGISYISLGILGATLSMVLLIYLGFRFTNLGLIFEAVAEDSNAARLRGIYASNILAMAWGFASSISAVGAILIAPVLYLSPAMTLSIFAYSLFAVVIGGLESPFGAFVGGVIVGVVENLADNVSFIGSELKFTAVGVMLIIVLIFNPRGLWGRREARRV